MRHYTLPICSHTYRSIYSNYTLRYDTIEHEHIITCNNEITLMRMANELYDTTFVEYSTPDIYCEADYNMSDLYYNEQWALNNTGQEDGVVGVDLKAEKAWAFLQHYNNNLGDSIRVAVVDNGVDTIHEDLTDALGHRRVLDGFPDLYGKGTPYDMYQYHGTACAGIIAASHNNVGIAGIAPNVLIVPIRIMRTEKIFVSTARIKKGITDAWAKYHAQILNNSWGTDRVRHSLIDKAFKNAVESGRNGRGCIVVVASGNNGSSQVEYPANLNDIIAVGAVDRCGIRAGCFAWTNSCDSWSEKASSYGSRLSVVAPGSHVFTIDRMGNAGENSSNYISSFSGTSAACPHVAGVAALILSVNPNLTHAQVKEIIEKTAQKVGPYNYTISDTILHPNGKWNNEMGYGMVNAFKALAETKIYGTEYTILGSSSMQLCNEYIYTLSGNVPDGYEIVWEVNPQMAIVSGQGTSTLVVRPIYQATGNWVKVRICYEGETIRDYKKSPIISTGVGHQLVIPHDSTITQNAFWNIERSLANSAIVDSGTVLTITSTIHCTDSARLIVRPGGKLVVDGGTLTSACPGELWQGIEVVGDRTKRQIAQYQGTVELRNGAVIKNAHCGIRTGLREDTVAFATTGGIIIADSAFFVNNRRAVEFLSYTNYSPSGDIADNQSHFTNCEFSVNDNNLFAQNSCSFIDHVTMCQVRGVEFNGCTFKNTTTAAGDRRHAINAEDAGFIVSKHCRDSSIDPNTCSCPEPMSTYCVFTGFSTAIEVNTTGYQHNVKVDFAQFNNNRVGVCVNSNQYATVTRCDFNLQDAPFSLDNTGLIMNCCTGYKVEENRFHKPSKSFYLTSTGILVNNSGVTNNSIYRNVFDTLDYGIRVTGINGNSGGGLQMTAGSFTNTTNDIHIAKGALVSPWQGTPRRGADNAFVGSATYNIYNAGPDSITYYHSNNSNYLPNSVSTKVGVNGSAATNPKTSTLCDPGWHPPFPLAGFQSSMNEYTTTLSQAGAADGTGMDGVGTQNFASLQQGGNETLTDMRQSLSDTYYEVVRTLMSDTVLDLNALEQWHAAAQPLGDPYSLTETRFMLGYSEPFVADADDAELSNYAEFHALKVSLRDNASDNDGSVGADDPSSLQPGGHINWYALTPSQIAQLQTIAERNTGRASVMAKGVLCFFHGICYEDEWYDAGAHTATPQQGDDTTGTRAKRTAMDTDNDATLSVYPNPTDDVLFIELFGGAEISIIALYDLQGRVVETRRAASLQKTTATLDMKSVPAGVYILRVTDTDGKEFHRKIVRK